MASHREVIEGFAKGKELRGSSVFARDNTLYSWGMHWPLAIVRSAKDSNKRKGWILLNGDSRSVSTNRHRNMTFGVFPNEPRVAFSALRAANVSPNECKLVDFWPDSNGESVTCPSEKEARDQVRKSMPPGATIGMYRDSNGDCVAWWHRIGAVVLEQHGSYYLCSMDEGSYFVSKLPHKVGSVEAAFKELVPFGARGKECKRQGEWFFVPTDKAINKNKARVLTLPYRPGQNLHKVRGVKVAGKYMCCGIVRHQDRRGRRTGQHRSLDLRDGVYVALRNRSKGDWSADGRVD